MPEIEAYRFGRVVIEGREYRQDIIVFPDRVQPDWWREEGHSLSVEDLATVLVEPPRLLVIGCGAYGRMKVSGETRRALEAEGIRVVAQRTAEAVATYNAVHGSGEVVAALHLTC